ncbi:MAG: aromatic acid exporter family protein [Clostridiales bacterium]|nr:aromatic acid exporter family protein [Clostridiales bacterium]
MRIKLPSVGMRVIKTILAIFVVLVLGELFWPYPPLFAAVVVVLSMQDTVSNSITFGLARILSILIGGSVGFGLLLLGVHNLSPYLNIPILCAAAFFCLYFTLVIKQPRSTAYALAMLFIAFFGSVEVETGLVNYMSVVRRIAETVAGVIIAVLINKFVCRYPFAPKGCECEEQEVCGEAGE